MKRYKPAPMTPELAPMMQHYTHIVERKQPKGRCRGCALRPGTAANRCGNTASKLMHVLLWGGVFACHHDGTADGKVVDDGARATRLCRGFKALMDGMHDPDDEMIRKLAGELK